MLCSAPSQVGTVSAVIGGLEPHIRNQPQCHREWHQQRPGLSLSPPSVPLRTAGTEGQGSGQGVRLFSSTSPGRPLARELEHSPVLPRGKGAGPHSCTASCTEPGAAPVPTHTGQGLSPASACRRLVLGPFAKPPLRTAGQSPRSREPPHHIPPVSHSPPNGQPTARSSLHGEPCAEWCHLWTQHRARSRVETCSRWRVAGARGAGGEQGTLPGRGGSTHRPGIRPVTWPPPSILCSSSPPCRAGWGRLLKD